MLKIAACATHDALLGEAPTNLRAELLAMTGHSFRRINRYIELAVFGALRCGHAAGGVAPDTALYLASDAPMLADCVKALKGVIADQRPPTPFEFMNISGNMAGFYIAQHLKMQGPQLAVHRSAASLECGLDLLALQSARHRRALLGYVEEGVWPLEEQRLRLDLPEHADMMESSHWFYLDQDCTAPLAVIEQVQRCVGSAALRQAAAETPADWSIRLGYRCDEDDLRVCRDVRADIPRPPAALPHSTATTALTLARFIENGGAAGLTQINRSDDGGYYVIRTRRTAKVA